LHAVDASDRLILDEAAVVIAEAAPGEVVVIGDQYGALTLGSGASGIRVFQDSIVSERALAANGAVGYENLPLSAELLTGARVVLLRLPRGLDELEDIAAAIAAWSAPDVTVYAGGRIKHMTLGMNEVLGRHFARLDVSLARQKSRVLIASGPLPSAAPELRREFHADLGLWICATGATFAGARIDIGTRALLAVLPQAAPDAATAADLGCGSGVVAAALAHARPGVAVLATDASAGAVASAAATARANGLTNVTVTRDDALGDQPDSSLDLVLLNPPFHLGGTLHTGAASKLFAAAARVLKPGGELWTVYNSHLAYRSELAKVVGETDEVSRNSKFTVTRSRKR
jgi:16S rRNA (guanine1207-N2)-methyltransferase